MGFLANIFGGGAIGLIAGVANKWISLKEQKQQLEAQERMQKERLIAEEKLIDKQMKFTELENKLKMQILDKEGDIAEQKGADASFQAAIKAGSEALGKNIQAAQWVVNLRGALRPIISYILLGGTILFILIAFFNPTLAIITAGTLLYLAVEIWLSLTGTCIGYWFGTRAVTIGLSK